MSASDSTALPSGRAASVAVSDARFAESASASVATGAINTGVCSVNATVTSCPATPALRSTTGAALTTATTSTVIVFGTASNAFDWSRTLNVKLA